VIRLETIDAHVAGAPLRLVVGGFPALGGRTMDDKRAWAARHADRLRRVLMLEPRGHADMSGAVLTEPTTPGSHAGVLFMDAEGFRSMCGSGIIGVTAIALERGLLTLPSDAPGVVFDTPVGTVRASCHSAAAGAAGGARRVAFTCVPSFVLQPGVEVRLTGRRLRADVAYGGGFYAIVDGEAAGVAVDGSHLGELRRTGREIGAAVEALIRIAHPAATGVERLDGVSFTAPPRGDADLRNATVFTSGAVDRSPCATGTAAVMAVLDAMGLLADDRPFVHEGLVGTTFAGTIAGRTRVGDFEAIVPSIEGSAWITGEHTFFVDDEDPLKEGFRLA
jgi:proline racemase